jgi:isoquinoline 1-oxidoreductase beta subunit
MPKLGRDISREIEEAPRQPTRRRFLTLLVAAPALTVATRVGVETLTPAKAAAVVPSPPQPADVTDFGDVMTALTEADRDLFVLQVTADNRIRFEVPRVRGGPGRHHPRWR